MDAIEQITRQEFNQLHSVHWGIECYHRAVKQLYGIERFMVRMTEAIKTYIFCSIRAFTQLELMQAKELIEIGTNCKGIYPFRWRGNLF